MQQVTNNLEKNQALFNCFISIQDPRVRGRCKHPLVTILAIVLLGLISGCDSWESMQLFAKTKKRWLSQFIDLSNGVPSSKTIARVMGLILPQEFERCAEEWVNTICQFFKYEHIAIDGKTMRGSSHKRSEKKASHQISAYNPRMEITVASTKTPDKSNEIKGIPVLLKKMSLKDKVITIDAMGTQKGIASLIAKNKGFYVLALKKNHKRFYCKVNTLFNKADTPELIPHVIKKQETVDYGHARYETRSYTIIPAMYLPKYQQTWKNLTAYVRVVSVREFADGKTETAIRYYITSLPYKMHHKIIESIRGHWSIENSLHWKLDVGMDEDKCQIYHGFADQNLNIMRKLVLKLLADEKTVKHGVKMKRLKAAMSTRYLKKVVGF